MSLTPVAPQSLVAPLSHLTLAPANVATLADGGYLVSFDTSTPTGGGTEVFAQRYDATGAKVGDLFQVNTTVALDESGGHADALADGGFVVIFSSAFNREATEIPSTYRAQRYDAAGQPVGGEVLIAPNDLNSQGGLPVAGLPGGGFVTAYGDFDGTRFNILVQRYGADGAPSGPSVVAGPGAGAGDIAVLSDGGYVMFVNGPVNTQDRFNTGVFVQRFDAAGAKVGGAVQANSTNLSGSNGDGDITALANAGFVVTWMASTPNVVGSFPHIQAQVFNAAGGKVGGEFQVNSSVSSTQFAPRIVGLPDGSFVVAWSSADGDGAGIFARQFSATGAPLSGEVLVNNLTAGFQGAPTATALTDGRIVIAWHDGASNTVQQRIFQADTVASQPPPPANTAPTLTAGADTVVPLSADQLVLTTTATLGSSDDLRAGAGIDTLRLTAPGALDLTAPVFFSGFERVEGTGAADTILVSQARLADLDLIDGGAGFDVLRLAAPGALDLGGITLTGIELIAGTSGADDLLGNGADNVLAGGAGNDDLNGRGGVDTATYADAVAGVTVNLASTKAQNTGGAGRDSLRNIENATGSAFADTLSGSAGANVLKGGGAGDRITGGAAADTFAYDALGDSTPGSRDLITDFSRAQGDRIDLRGLDATAGGADDAFAFVSAFSGVAGQLAVSSTGSGRFLVQGDVNGDRAADFTIEVISPSTLTASDFLL